MIAGGGRAGGGIHGLCSALLANRGVEGERLNIWMGRVAGGLKRRVSCVHDTRGRKGRGGIHGLC